MSRSRIVQPPSSSGTTFAAGSRHNESRDHTRAKRNNHFHLVHELLTFLPLLRLYLVRRFSKPNLTNLFLPTHEAEDVEEEIRECKHHQLMLSIISHPEGNAPEDRQVNVFGDAGCGLTHFVRTVLRKTGDW